MVYLLYYNRELEKVKRIKILFFVIFLFYLIFSISIFNLDSASSHVGALLLKFEASP